MVATNVAVAVAELFGDVTGESIKQALEGHLITAIEAQALMGYVVMPPKPTPDRVEVTYGLDNYNRHCAGSEDRRRQVGLHKFDLRRKAMQQDVQPGMVLRGSTWVRI